MDGLRLIGGTNGRADVLADAVEDAHRSGLAVMLLGDVVGRPADVDSLRVVHRLLEGATVEVVPGREEYLLRRYAEEGDEHAAAVLRLLAPWPVWRRINGTFIVRSAFVPQMLFTPAPRFGALGRHRRLALTAIFGEPYPWEDLVPEGLAVHVLADRTKVIPAGAGAVWNHGPAGSPPLDIPADELRRPWAPPAVQAPAEPLLTLLIGPAGAGKSTWAARHAAPGSVVSTDALRAELLGDHRDQSHAPRIFAEAQRRAAWRLNRGLPVVYDATNLSARERRAMIDLLPPGHPVRYVIVDRPLADKLRDGGWRLEVRCDGETLVERHHRAFANALPNILAGDHLPQVIVEDARGTS